MQKTEVEILDEIVRLCDENNLEYFLIGGTLLGAVRHKGFIPWDDDLDIAMPRDSFDRFIQLCSDGKLDKKYYLHSLHTDKEYWLIFPKIRKHHTLFDEKNIAHLDTMKGIYVDIFPLDDAKSEDSRSKRFRTMLIKHISGVIYYKKKIPVLNRKQQALYRLLSWMSIPFLSKVQNTLMQWENKKGNTYFVNFGSNYNTVKQTMPKNVYQPAKKIEFEGKMYSCPNNYEYVLRRLYGKNYMELPPAEKRRTHQPLRISFDTESDE